MTGPVISVIPLLINLTADIRSVPLIFSFYRWGKQGTDKLNNSSKDTQLLNESQDSRPGSLVLKFMLLLFYGFC